VRRGDGRQALLLGWVALVLIFFSASLGKRGVYMYPALPALAVALAPLLPGLLRRRDVRILAGSLAALIAAALLIAGGALAGGWLPARLLVKAADQGVDAALLASLATPALIAGAAATALIAWARRGPLALVGCLACGWIVVGALVLPRLNAVRQPGALMARADALAGATGELGMLRFKEQYVLMAPRGLTTFGYQRRDVAAEIAEGVAWLGERPGRVLLVSTDILSLTPFTSTRMVAMGWAHGDDWLAARAESLGR